MQRSLFLPFVVVFSSCLVFGQQQSTALGAAAGIPLLVKFSGVLSDSAGKPLIGIQGVTFALYREQQGGAPLWLETQNVTADQAGRYNVALGASSAHGLPAALFTSEEARWLGVQVAGQNEQARVLLLSVPYAVKAGDAETVGGLPASAFVLAQPVTGSGASAPMQSTVPPSLAMSSTPCVSLSSTGTESPDQLPVFTTTPCKLGPSQIFDNGINVGLGTKSPSAKLDVAGSAFVRGTLNLPATGTASSTHTAGFPSQAFDLFASAWNTSGTPAANIEHFRWQAEPARSNTASPSGTLSLLFASGTNPLAETGLKIASNGRITFAPGQTIPTVTGNETVTGNVRATQLISTVATGTPPLSVTSTTQVPNLNASLLGGKASSAYALLGASNSFVGDQGVTGNVTATGTVRGSAANFNGGNSTTLNVTQTGTGDGMDVISAGEGIVVETSGSLAVVTNNGIFSSGNSNFPAIYGTNSLGPAGQFDGGVLGNVGTSQGIGVHGTAGAPSGLALKCCIAVWGDSGTQGNTGVYGTANDGIAVAADNNSSTGVTLLAVNNSKTAGALIFETEGFGRAAPVIPTCFIDVDGNLSCTGKKSAVVSVDGGKKMVALYAEESPENWFADYGSAQLVDGAATVRMEPIYAQTVNTKLEYHVFVTPKGDCRGLYVTNQTPSSFEVRELQSGRSNIAFDYRIVAKRTGTEQIRLADKTAMMKAAEANAARLRDEARSPAKLAAGTPK